MKFAKIYPVKIKAYTVITFYMAIVAKLGSETSWAGKHMCVRRKMALEDEYGLCTAEDQNFNMTHIALYRLLGVILVFELVLGVGLIVVGCILYCKNAICQHETSTELKC